MLTIAERINNIIIGLGIDPINIDPSCSLDEIGLDSLDRADFICALEEEFGITISDVDAQHIGTLQQAIDYVAKKIA